MEQVILPLDGTPVSLERGGGKGANLARLVRAGLPVPPGFVIATAAYRAFVAANDLSTTIQTTLADLTPDDPAALAAASDRIRACFAEAPLPPALAAAITAAYADLDHTPVAVRSSATAEDLPDLSFAGQQDTLLNVRGSDFVLRAVVTCWSSLWTARAIGYRARNGLGQNDLALAVIVQRMVPSAASGVLFTANPLTGKRRESVIDATLGLGEALVSGQVEPDQFVVDSTTGRVLHRQIGSKAIAIHGRDGGGTDTVPTEAATIQAIDDGTIRRLDQIGQYIARVFGTPQDIEWAVADDRIWIVQSRPITSLFPLPAALPAQPLHALISFGAVQGVLDPLTPLGRDLFRHFAATGATFVHRPYTADTQRFAFEAGERLFMNITGALRHRRFRRVLRGFLRLAEPAVGEAIERVWNEPDLAPRRTRIRITTLVRVGRGAARLIANLLLNLLRPTQRRAAMQARIEGVIADYAALQHGATTLAERIALLERTPPWLGSRLLPYLLPLAASGILSQRLLAAIAGQLPDGSQLALRATRGLPHNVTTEMDLLLWQTAQTIARDADGSAALRKPEPALLARQFETEGLPPVAQNAIAAFLRRYGMRGIAEIDVGHARWGDQPQPIIQTLQSYAQIDDPDRAPDAVFARGAADAEAAIEQIVRELRGTPRGWIKARLARWLARRTRELAGLRETPKLTIVRVLGLIRAGLLESGRDLADAGVIDQPDDLFFLRVDELRALAGGEQRDWRSLIDERRASYARELRRRQVPRLLLSDGRAFFDGVAATSADDGALIGSPVSPGTVEGVVHVVWEPHKTRLAPGEILVCHGTDPAWTPLFLAAGGLITEVGGLMTHGSVVAREYGIPAVVGVDHATTRLHTGQRVRVDGSSGRVTLLTSDGALIDHLVE